MSFLTTVRFWLPYIIETFIQPNVIKHQQQQKNKIETKTYLKFFQPFNQIWESRRTRILQSSNHFRSIENNAVTVSSLEGGPRNREEFGVGKPGRQWNHFRRGRVQKFHQMPNRIVVAVGRNLRQKLVVIHSSKKKKLEFLEGCFSLNVGFQVRKNATDLTESVQLSAHSNVRHSSQRCNFFSPANYCPSVSLLSF